MLCGLRDSGKIAFMGRGRTFTSLCAMVLWFGGCPKRQGPARIVYVPAPAPHAAATATNQPVLVLEEPAPPAEPEEAPPTPEPKPAPKVHRPTRTETPTTPADASSTESPEPPPAAIPALEPRESTMQETALRQEVQRVQEDVRQRLARLNQARLSSSERKTLEDARTFLVQSARALERSDLQRALNLARKSSLLVGSLE
jgi:hypothetical protein